MFKVEWARRGKVIDGHKKTTICRIFLIGNGSHPIAVGESHWNYEQDEYDLQTGQYEAMKRAVYNLPENYADEFYAWMEKL